MSNARNLSKIVNGNSKKTVGYDENGKVAVVENEAKKNKTKVNFNLGLTEFKEKGDE